MKWQEIKKSIQDDLLSRNLKNPNIRLNALKRLEQLFKIHFPEFIENPKQSFNAIDKNELKKKLSVYKDNDKITSSESSIINEIYYRI